MNKKQIRKDYGIEDYIDAKGKVRSKVFYRGKYYDYEDSTQAKPLQNTFILLTIYLIISYVVVMAVDSEPTRQLYFLLPFVAQCFTIFFIVLGAYNIIFKKPPFKQEQKTAIFDKSRSSAIAGIVLSAGAFVGGIIKLIVVGAVPLDSLPIILAATMVISYAFLLGMVAKTKVIEVNAQPTADIKTETADSSNTTQQTIDNIDSSITNITEGANSSTSNDSLVTNSTEMAEPNAIPQNLPNSNIDSSVTNDTEDNSSIVTDAKNSHGNNTIRKSKKAKPITEEDDCI